MWTKNYDIRYLSTESQMVMVKNTIEKSAGTYPVLKKIGSTFRSVSIFKPAHTAVVIEMNEKSYEIESFNPISQLKKGDSVRICYNIPKYYGEIFALRIVGPNTECSTFD